MARIRHTVLFAAVALFAAQPALAGGEADGNAGLAALKSGRYNDAARLFSRALSDNRLSRDDREFAFYNRADAYAKLGDEQHALADLDQAMRLKPDDNDAQAAFGQMMQAHHTPAGAGPPLDFPTCSANFTKSGSFAAGRRFSTWAQYAQLMPLDAYAAAFRYIVANSWNVTNVDFGTGSITASQPIPGVSGATTQIEVRVVQLPGGGSRTTLTQTVGPNLLSLDSRGDLCRMLAALPN